ncbi:MAG TPA: energy transducer TonB [Pyrinomonadaceae bacterium]|nr:energy transducer TonB [Pyrinomonadaceae bacterium]
MKLFYNTTLFFVLIFSTVSVFGQQSDVEVGIELYQKGDFQGAIANLKNDETVFGLYYLALSYDKLNQKKEAGETFGKTFNKIFPIIIEDLEFRLSNNNKNVKSSFVHFLDNQKLRIQIGAISADKAVRLKAKMSKEADWKEKAVTMVGLFELLKTTETLYANDEVETEVKFLKKSYPSYTDAARQNRFAGQIKLFAVLAADGTVKHIIPLTSLPFGLTEQCIIATEKLKFEPAIKDDKAVSTVKIFNYSFMVAK